MSMVEMEKEEKEVLPYLIVPMRKTELRESR